MEVRYLQYIAFRQNVHLLRITARKFTMVHAPCTGTSNAISGAVVLMHVSNPRMQLSMVWEVVFFAALDNIYIFIF